MEPETGWSDCLTLPSMVRDPAVLSVQRRSSGILILDHSAQTNDLLEPNTNELGAREDKVARSDRPQPNRVWSARFCLHVLLCDPC